VTADYVEVRFIWRKNNALGYVHIFRRARYLADPLVCPVAVISAYLSYRAACLRSCGGRATAPAPADGSAVPDYFFVHCTGRTPSRAISRDMACSWLRKAIVHLGLDPRFYAMHCPRISAAAAMWARGKSVLLVMQMGYWTTVSGVLTYLRRDAAADAGLTDVFLDPTMASRGLLSQAEQEAELVAAMNREVARRELGLVDDDASDSDDD